MLGFLLILGLLLSLVLNASAFMCGFRFLFPFLLVFSVNAIFQDVLVISINALFPIQVDYLIPGDTIMHAASFEDAVTNFDKDMFRKESVRGTNSCS